MTYSFAKILPQTNVEVSVEEKRIGRGIKKITHTTKYFSNGVICATDNGLGNSACVGIDETYLTKVRKAFNKKYPELENRVGGSCTHYDWIGHRVVATLGTGTYTYTDRSSAYKWAKQMVEMLKTIEQGVELVRKAIEIEDKKNHEQMLDDMVWKIKHLSEEDRKELFVRLGVNA